MEDYERLKLRLACLELAKQVAIAQASGLYGIVDDAEKYWKFVAGDAEMLHAHGKTGDDIPF